MAEAAAREELASKLDADIDAFMDKLAADKRARGETRKEFDYEVRLLGSM